MARTRKSYGRKSGVFTRLWSPFGHTVMAGSNTVGAVADTAKGVVGVGAKGVNRIGRSVTGHFNAAVHDLLRGVTRKGRKGRKSRKGGKARKTRGGRRRNV